MFEFSLYSLLTLQINIRFDTKKDGGVYAPATCEGLSRCCQVVKVVRRCAVVQSDSEPFDTVLWCYGIKAEPLHTFREVHTFQSERAVFTRI